MGEEPPTSITPVTVAATVSVTVSVSVVGHRTVGGEGGATRRAACDMFGGSPAPTLFGGSTPSATGTPGTLAQPPATSAFGSSGFGGFGNGTTAPAAATSGTGFGSGIFGTTTPGGPTSTTPAPAVAPTGSLFGQQPQQQQTAFGFGATMTTMTTPTPGVAPIAAATATAPAGSIGAAPHPESELAALAAAYTASSPQHRFNYVFYDLDVPASLRTRPASLDDARWREALDARARYLPESSSTADAGAYVDPDRLWPVLVSGFDALVARKRQQDEALERDEEYLRGIEEMRRKVQAHVGHEVRGRVAELRRKQQRHAHALLRIIHKLDAVASAHRQRYALAAGAPMNDAALRRDDAAISASLERLERMLSSEDASSIASRVGMLAANARLAGAPNKHVSGGASALLDAESEETLLRLLSQQTNAVRKLEEALRRDKRDIGILSSKTGPGSTGAV